MQEYSFKPAPVRKTQVWAIKDGHLIRRGGASALKLADVTSANWNSVSYRATRSVWLNLSTDTDTTRIEFTDNGGARDEFFALITAISTTLSQVNPELQIAHGYSAPWRTALFIIGLAGSALGLFLIFAGLTNMTGKGAVEATISGAAMTLLLLPVAWSCRPNLNATTFGPAGLLAEIADFGGAPMFEPDHSTRQE